jgi:hypothetical protein
MERDEGEVRDISSLSLVGSSMMDVTSVVIVSAMDES